MWLDKNKTSSYAIYQYLVNSDDSKVATYSNITPATSGSQAATGLSESTTYYYTITTVSAGGDYCEGDYAELDAWLKSLPLSLKKRNEDVAKLCSNEWSEKGKL